MRDYVTPGISGLLTCGLGVFTIDYFLKYEGLKQAVFHQNDYGMGAAVLFGAVLIGLGITIYSAGKRSES
jgi:hypothetical protein